MYFNAYVVLKLSFVISFWISDEYGPYIYRFSQTGQIIQAIQLVISRDYSGDQGNLFLRLIPTSQKLNIFDMKGSKV